MKNPKNIVKLLVILLSIFVGSCLGSPSTRAPGFLIELGQAGKYVTVTVTNASQKAMRMPGLDFALSKGAPGLYLSINDASGKLHTMCAMVDQVYTGDYVVPSRGYLLTNLSSDFLRRVYCLLPGKYTIIATFADRNNLSVDSIPMNIVIKQP